MVMYYESAYPQITAYTNALRDILWSGPVMRRVIKETLEQLVDSSYPNDYLLTLQTTMQLPDYSRLGEVDELGEGSHNRAIVENSLRELALNIYYLVTEAAERIAQGKTIVNIEILEIRGPTVVFTVETM